jgi:hypothetical protein
MLFVFTESGSRGIRPPNWRGRCKSVAIKMRLSVTDLTPSNMFQNHVQNSILVSRGNVNTVNTFLLTHRIYSRT